MTSSLPLGELAAATALLGLREAAVGILDDVRELGETPDQTLLRLEQMYASINVAVGVRAVPLVRLLRALQACTQSMGFAADDISPFVAQVAARGRAYGPPLREMQHAAPPTA